MVPDAIIPLVPAVDQWTVVLGDNKTADGTLSGMPTNIVRAELNLLPSHHANDEFYYTALVKRCVHTLTRGWFTFFKPWVNRQAVRLFNLG